MKDHTHPADLPEFNAASKEPVWYLAHPLAPDEHKTFQENMAHVVDMIRLCYDEGFRVIAPYHTICLALDDENSEHRRIGLEVDCLVARKLGRLILSGHKVSKGMLCEIEAVRSSITIGMREQRIINLIELSDNEARASLRRYREWLMKRERGNVPTG